MTDEYPEKKCGREMQPGPGQQNGLLDGLCVRQPGLLSLWYMYDCTSMIFVTDQLL